jgi:HSP20 family protein
MTTQTAGKDLIPNLQRKATSAFAPLQRELNRFFDEIGDGWNAFSLTAPPVDVVDTDTGMEITVELPGLSRDEVKITAEDDMLNITGEKKVEHEKKDDNYRVLERTYGEFSRSIYLPRSVDPQKITAEMKNGLLKIVVPKRDGVETRTIEIQAK